MARERCNCGCGQPTAATMRMRKLKCDVCGCPLRMSRSWLEVNGAPACGCGGVFVPDCLEDRCRLPGEAGEAAWVEWQGRETVRAVCAENGAKGGAVSARKARVRRMTRDERQELARRDPNRTIHDNEMPF
jgi:hypothetical protein